VECAWASLKYNPWAKGIYDRICGKQKTRKKKAAVALARKIAVLAWAMLRDEKDWDPKTMIDITETYGRMSPSLKESLQSMTDVAFKTGIEKHAVDGKTVSVYSREKTLADCFSRRNEVGLDVAIEALKFYMAQGNVKVDLIMEYATKLRVAKTMRPYLEALL
jgi:hypothetical protein